MKVENNKIIKITESELFDLYLKRGFDDIMSFIDYKEEMKKSGTKIIKDKKGKLTFKDLSGVPWIEKTHKLVIKLSDKELEKISKYKKEDIFIEIKTKHKYTQDLYIKKNNWTVFEKEK